MRRNNVAALTLAGISLVMLLGGCQSKTASGTPAAQGSAVKAEAPKPKKIIVGTGNAYKNVCFLDEKNNLTGFEIETLKKIDELLPQYEFEYKVFDFGAILVSLETGKIDLAAHQFEVNADRKTKFLFADEGVARYDLRIVVKEGSNDIKSLEDLVALNGTVQVGSASSNNTYIVDKWNKEHGSKLKTVLAPSDATVTLQNLESGKIDAFISIERTVEEYKKTYQAKLKVVGEPISFSNAYYLYQKNNNDAVQLKKDVDETIAKLKDDGTLKKLSVQWFGLDYIPPKGK